MLTARLVRQELDRWVENWLESHQAQSMGVSVHYRVRLVANGEWHPLGTGPAASTASWLQQQLRLWTESAPSEFTDDTK